ncbi:MAG: [protein-PII] uridylyltransferase, partial [Microthrixaceae bacterium]|nr:[protein-PII] uridylyltransferase [Microthrixaceae bacterium]
RTPKETLKLAAEDLDTATALLQLRHLAGAPALTDDLAARARAQWRKRPKKWLTELGTRVASRHAQAGEVAFLLEPDLKEGRGGLRDVHALHWAELLHPVLHPGDDAVLERAYGTVLDVRVALHRHTGRPGDHLHLQDQDAVAELLGLPDADALMRSLATAARTIAWVGDETWERVESSLAGPRRRTAGRDRPLDDGVVLRDGEVHVAADATPADDPALVLRAAAAAAGHGVRLERASLDRLAAEAPLFPDPWPEGARDLLASLLLTGPAAIRVLEALDHKGLLSRMLPEWEPVRSRPQRNAYHRFTVDRHLLEAAAGAARLADRVARPDLLVIGALLHDIGKGYPGDHTIVGQDLVATIATRMGFPPGDVDTLVLLVRHHLLLPDIATRRDLNDDATIERVADEVGSLEALELLAALTEADSIATGPAAWGDWKAGLVARLVARTAHRLGGGDGDAGRATPFPSPEQRVAMAEGQPVIRVDGDDTIWVVAPDRPGLFSRVAGVLALNGLGVLEAAAASDQGVALSQFTVTSSFGPSIDWDGVVADLERCLAGRLALAARLADRARTYARPGAPSRVPDVRFDNDTTRRATVIEVHAADGVGVLNRITRALADLDLDIRTAKVQTLGDEVVDAFYVLDHDGAKITEADHQDEIRRAVLHGLR